MKNLFCIKSGFVFVALLIAIGAPHYSYAGKIAAWGSNSFGQTRLPSGLNDIKAIDAGYRHNLALRANGTVAAWGWNNYGQSSVPDGPARIVAISAGHYFNLALRNDGTVIAWGRNLEGQTNVPAGLSNIIAIAAGGSHSLALKSDGTLVSWGQNFSGVTNVPVGLADVVAIDAGYTHSLVLKADGTVVAWGGPNKLGELNVPEGLSNVIAIAAGGNHNLALKTDGTVVAWGKSEQGQINVPAGLSNVVKIAAGMNQSLVLKADGSVMAWGMEDQLVGKIPVGLANVTALSGGYDHALALVYSGPLEIVEHPQSQSVAQASNVTFSVLATGAEPIAYQWLRNGSSVSDNPRYIGRTDATLTITDAQFSDAGTYSVIVSNAFGFVMSTGATLVVIGPPSIVERSPDRSVRAGTNINLFVNAVGTPPLSYQWSLNGTVLPSRTNSSFSLSNVQFSNSGTYSVSVTNAYGQAQTNIELHVTNTAPYLVKQPFVRNPNQTTTTNPVVPLGGSVLFEMDAKGSTPLRFQWQFNGANIFNATNTTLALSNLQYEQTGFYTVVVSNSFGQTVSAKIFLNVVQVFAWGTPFTYNTNTPVGLTNVIAIAAGGSHITALKSDGTLKSWLASPDFVYGAPSVTNIPPSATNIVAIDCGTDHTLALRSNGTVIAWGGNANGQTNVPPNLSNVVAVAAGFGRSFAINKDGSVVGWGTQGIVPPGLSNVVAISIAKNPSSRNYALRRDGSVRMWPVIETFTSVSNAIAIAGTSAGFLTLRPDGTVWSSTQRIFFPQNLSNVVAIAANHTAGWALKADGTVVGSTPAGEAPKLTNVTAIASGGEKADFGVALIGRGAPTFALHPFSQEPQKGATVQLHARATGIQPMRYQWQLEKQNILGATNGSLIITNFQGKNTGAYRLQASNALGTVFSATAHLTIPFNTNLAGALNATNLVWQTLSTTNSPNVWFAQIRETHDGDAAAQSGGISHNQQSQLAATVVGPGTLTFWWKVSSEAGYDFLRFNVGSEPQPRAVISGEVGWEKRTFSILPGNQTLRWTYIKDGTVSSGQDAGWLDEVSFPKPPPTIIRHPGNRTVLMGANVVFAGSAEGVGPLNYQWLRNGTNLPGRTASFFTLTNVMPSDAGSYALRVFDPYNSVTSSNAVLTVLISQVLEPLHFLPDGSAILWSRGANGEALNVENVGAFEIQASTNVKDWLALPITPTLTDGSLMFHDTNSKNFPMRFYRIVEH